MNRALVPVLLTLLSTVACDAVPHTRVPTADGTRLTIPQAGVSVTVPRGEEWDVLRMSDGSFTLHVLGVGYTSPSYKAIFVNARPEADSLADMKATIRARCYKSEVLAESTQGDGFDLLYRCDDGFRYLRVLTAAGGRRVECSNAGSLRLARAARQVCSTMAGPDSSAIAGASVARTRE